MNHFLKKTFLIALYTLLLLFYCSKSNAQNLSLEKKNEVEQYKQLVAQYQTQNNKNQIAAYLTKIAFIYWEAGLNNDAISYFSQAIEVNKSNGNKNAVRTISNYIGLIYSDMQQWDHAIQFFNHSLTLSREMKMKDQIVSSLTNLSTALQNKGNFSDAIKYLEEALTLGQEINDLKVIRKCYGMLAESYEKTGNSNKAKKYFDLYSLFDKKIKDDEMRDVKAKSEIAVATANADRKTKELELKMQTYKLKETKDSLQQSERQNKERQMEIELLQKQKKLNEQEAQLQSEKTMRFFLIGIFSLILIFALVIFKQLKDKRKAYKLLAVQHEELQQKNNHIEYQNNLLENQNTELQNKNEQIGKQKLLLEKQNSDLIDKNHQIEYANILLAKKNQQITDSINYASRIQKAILPSNRAIKANFSESFILYQPRDIVSGDFYWFTKQDEKIFIAAVDCTGHSVPGAFMSMIGNTLLNEIIIEKKIHDPAVVLQKLNYGIINNLKQQSDTEELQQDGMDITLCCFDFKNKVIEISSANHTVYKFNGDGLEIIEGDIFSIGEQMNTSEEQMHFTTHVRPIEENTTVYLFSDGFQDQLGGDGVKRQKFMSRQFRKMLEDIQPLSMDEQHDYLWHALENWRGEAKQTDDILVIGLRIKDLNRYIKA